MMRKGLFTRRIRSAVFLLGLLVIASLAAGCIGGITGIGFGSGGDEPGVTDRGQPLNPKVAIPKTDAELPPHVENEVLVGVLPGADIAALAAAADAEVLLTLDQIDVVHLRLKGDGRSLTDALRALEEMPGVRYSQPNYSDYRLPYAKANALPPLVGLQAFTEPNDPDYHTYQWGPQRIRAPFAWEAGITGEGTIIAVLDTGVDPNHPDLAGRVLPGANPLDPQNRWHDFDGHGTHVAGIAAAGMNDGIGIAGVAPGAKIFPIRVFEPSQVDGKPVATDLEIVLSLLVAADPRSWGFPYDPADVANMSFAGSLYSPAVADAVHFAIEQGVTLVAAVGNQHAQSVRYPASYPGVIAVGATDPQDRKANFSNTSPYISVSAPGERIWSTVPGGYDLYNGTSMAAPHVAGAVALLREARPGISPAEVKRLLEQTADPGDTFSRETGWGRINVARALGLEDLALDIGDIAVTVQDATGKKLAWAEVVLYRGEQAIGNILTGGSVALVPNAGLAVFRGLEPGDDYKITVRLDTAVHGRYALKAVPGISVEAGKTTDLIVVL